MVRHTHHHHHHYNHFLLLLLIQLNPNNNNNNHHLFTNAAINDQNPICSHSQSQDLGCPTNDEYGDHYTCRIGTKDYSTLFPGVNSVSSISSCNNNNSNSNSNNNSNNNNSNNGQSPTYCDCNEQSIQRGESGVTGCYCQTHVAVCNDGTTCFHGAPCVRVIGDNNDNDNDNNDSEDNEENESYICGCAYTQDDTQTTWVGEHCEYEPEDICDTTKYDVSHNGNWFCTNGYCNNAIVNPREKCICDDGYYGLHCEFKNVPPTCDITCQNNGICTRGFKPPPSSSSSSSEQQQQQQSTSSYCVCPEGYTGVTCEIQVDVSNRGCEDFPCLHGSTCRLGNNETQTYYCDCSTIADTDDDDNDNDEKKGTIVPYAGVRCEHIMTMQCDVPEGYDKRNYFCTNGGSCPLDFHRACICPTGTSGPRCEFMTEEPTKECSLPCINNGQCFFGSYPPNTDPYDIDFTKPENSEMHCKCPQGYTGALCAIKVELCPGGTHACANSGDCVKDGEEWMCDCSKALLGVTPARGEKCENPATSYCVGPGANLDSFCTNDGVCKDYVVLDGKNHPGCICRKGYYGDYCEFYDPNYHKSGVAQKAFLGFTISLFLLLLLFLIWKFSRTDDREPIPNYSYEDEQNNSKHVPDGYVLDDPMELPGEYEDEDDINLDGMDNVIGMDHVYVN